jgi:hypothetical protein
MCQLLYPTLEEALAFIPFMKEAANPAFCTDPSETNLTYNWFPVDLISSGILYPQKAPNFVEVASPPSLISI